MVTIDDLVLYSISYFGTVYFVGENLHRNKKQRVDDATAENKDDAKPNNLELVP